MKLQIRIRPVDHIELLGAARQCGEGGITLKKYIQELVETRAADLRQIRLEESEASALRKGDLR